jgi:hypothetical protein
MMLSLTRHITNLLKNIVQIAHQIESYFKELDNVKRSVFIVSITE